MGSNPATFPASSPTKIFNRSQTAMTAESVDIQDYFVFPVYDIVADESRAPWIRTHFPNYRFSYDFMDLYYQRCCFRCFLLLAGLLLLLALVNLYGHWV
jgi:hypothetical protein